MGTSTCQSHSSGAAHKRQKAVITNMCVLFILTTVNILSSGCVFWCTQHTRTLTLGQKRKKKTREQLGIKTWHSDNLFLQHWSQSTLWNVHRKIFYSAIASTNAIPGDMEGQKWTEWVWGLSSIPRLWCLKFLPVSKLQIWTITFIIIATLEHNRTQEMEQWQLLQFSHLRALDLISI